MSNKIILLVEIEAEPNKEISVKEFHQALTISADYMQEDIAGGKFIINNESSNLKVSWDVYKKKN